MLNINFLKSANFSVLVLLMSMSLSSKAQTASVDEPARLSVRGEAQLMVPPDQVSVTIGVVSEAKQVKSALQDNSEKMRATIAVLTGLGFDEDDYQTQNFSIRPVWSSHSNLSSSKKREIVAYNVSNNLLLKTSRIDDVGDIIAAVTQAGVNQIHSIQFGLQDPRRYREQAIKAASVNAKTDATALASANEVSIVRVLTLNLDNTSASIKRVSQPEMMQARAMSDSAPPIQAGDIAVRASVSVVYEIVDRK